MSVSVFKKPSANPIASKDVAETFGESGLELTTDGTDIRDGAVGLSEQFTGNVVSRVNDNQSSQTSLDSGLVVNPNVDLGGLRGDISNNTTDAITAYLKDSVGEVLDSSAVSGGSFELYAPMTAGADYSVSVDNDGDTYDAGLNNDDAAFPYSGTDMDIVAGYRGGDHFDSVVWGVDNLEGFDAEMSGTVWVGWPEPSDVYRWDAATYQVDEDGESVIVDVQESSDGGASWVTIATDIQRGQELTADPGNRVRYRVSIEREDTSNDPQLGAIYRRWVV